MIVINKDYEFILGNLIGVYRFIENEDNKEKYWVDSQNCMYYTNEGGNESYNENTGLINGNHWWIIWPAKPIGTIITKENQNQIKWFVIESSKTDDELKEWDFNSHKPIK